MRLDDKILARFDALIEQGNRVLATKKVEHVSMPIVVAGQQTRTMPNDVVDFQQAIQWGVNCRHLLKRIFNTDSDHYMQFTQNFEFANSPLSVMQGLAVIRAAKDDYEQDMLFDTRVVIAAEVFDDFLEQADHLHNQGYHQAAAIIAGAVLEDGLRKLCDRKGMAQPQERDHQSAQRRAGESGRLHEIGAEADNGAGRYP